MTIQEAIKAVVAGENLSLEQSRAVFTDIMSGKATDAQIAAFIVGLRMKGETVSEITGAASVMREKATRVLPENGAHLVDTCGTGGDGSIPSTYQPPPPLSRPVPGRWSRNTAIARYRAGAAAPTYSKRWALPSRRRRKN